MSYAPAVLPGLAALTTLSAPALEPIPIVLVEDRQMPQVVSTSILPFEQVVTEGSDTQHNPAIESYNMLKSSFNISHTKMAMWLGIKRRTLYNWRDAPESGQFVRKIEQRIANLTALKNEMEENHYKHLEKVAFSPIYGDPAFGELILNGGSGEELISCYDRLFGNFEHCIKCETNTVA